MRITVFGATGGTGGQVLQQALAAGHDVVAPVRDPGRLATRHERLEVLRADVLDAASIAGSVAGADAVISTIGGRARAERAAGVQGPGTRNIIEAMRAGGTRRLLVVSAAPVAPADSNDTWVLRNVAKPMMLRILPTAYADMAQMEAAVRDSALEWTIVRPPRLTNRPPTGHYRYELDRTVRGAMSLRRADLADALLRFSTDPATIKTAIGICN